MRQAIINVAYAGCLAMLIGVTGCTQMETGDSTTMGAAAGGVVGSGLGAIVGNQVGNTGEGLVIGAVAGAGTGALIGSALDRQQQAMSQQDEAIERQERIMQAQQNELNELRQLGQDSVTFKDERTTPIQSAQGGQYSFPVRPPVRTAQNSMVASQRALPASSGYVAPVAPRLPTTQSVRSATPSRNTSIQERSLVEPEPLKPQMMGAVEPEGSSARGSYGWNNPTPQANAIAPVVVEKSIEREVPTFVDTGTPSLPQADSALPQADSALPQADSALPQADSSLTPVKAAAPQENMAPMAGQALSLNTPECSKADTEARSAATAREAADKLFHYRRALRLCPDNATYHNGLGEVYITLNRKEDARFEFNEALRLSPGHGAAQSNLSSLQ